MKRLSFVTGVFLIAILGGCTAVRTSTPQPIVHIETPFPAFTFTPSPTFTIVPPSSTPKTPLLLKKGPYLVFTGSPEGMNVIWQSEKAEDFVFEWGLDETYSMGSSVPSGDPESILYQVRLSGLVPATQYFYRISTGSAEVHGSFFTPATSTDALTFFAYGDSRSGPDTHNGIATSILEQISLDPAAQTFILSTGDLMTTATEESLQEDAFAANQTAIRKMLSILPVVNAMGNHDGTALFKQYFPYPFTTTYDWSFDYGPAHFTIIDQYIEMIPGSERWQWLKNDLSKSEKPWKFILLHAPGWSAGPHENNEMVQKIIHPLAAANGVQMIIAGHNHYYARAEVDSVIHLTTGGGGAPLYDPENGWPRVVKSIKAFHYVKIEIQGNQLSAQVISPLGEILDEFSITNEEY